MFSKRTEKKHFDDTNPKKYSHVCKQCSSIRTRLRFFKITLVQFNNLCKLQNDSCAICNKKEIECRNQRTKHYGLYVDHNHKTDEIRGLLCHNCNLIIGHAKDNISLLNNAIKYLKPR